MRILTVKTSVTNVASVPKRSPFRYPGGKTWLIPEVRTWLSTLKPRLLIEPFAGGGIVSLTAVAEGLVERAILCERDEQVSAAWNIILDEPEWLVRRILAFEMKPSNVKKILSAQPTSRRELGFQTIVRNRAQRGGILAKGASLMKSGENGKGLSSRWYPDTLASRIRDIQAYRERIIFVHGNGIDLIQDHVRNPDAAFFIDPPYTAGGKRAGKRLYNHNRIDHEGLFLQLAQATGSFMMTYDDSEEVETLSQRKGFTVLKVPMKNTHHAKLNELLIFPPGYSLQRLCEPHAEQPVSRPSAEHQFSS